MFWHFINTAAYYYGRYEPYLLRLKSSMVNASTAQKLIVRTVANLVNIMIVNYDGRVALT